MREAKHQLDVKTNANTSKNVFLLVHPLDHMVTECIRHEVIAPLLGPLDDLDDLDTVWVLWVPDHLTTWSKERCAWTDLFFRAATYQEAQARLSESNSLAVLQEVEQYFLTRIGHTDGSPYLFELSFE